MRLNDAHAHERARAQSEVEATRRALLAAKQQFVRQLKSAPCKPSGTYPSGARGPHDEHHSVDRRGPPLNTEDPLRPEYHESNGVGSYADRHRATGGPPPQSGASGSGPSRRSAGRSPQRLWERELDTLRRQMEAAEEELRLRRHEVAPTPLVPAYPETRASPPRDRNFACYGSGTSGHAAAPVGAGDESAATCSGCGVSLMNATAPYADPHPSNDDLGPDGPTVIFVPVPWGPTAPFPFQPFTLQSEGAVPLPETIDPPPFPHGPFAVPSPPNHSRPSRESRKTVFSSR
jgi:hypothetical protein